MVAARIGQRVCRRSSSLTKSHRGAFSSHPTDHAFGLAQFMWEEKDRIRS